MSPYRASDSSHTHLQHRREGIEEPPVTIYLLLVLFLHAKNYLCRHNAFVRVFKVQIGIQREGSGIFKKMSSDLFVIDHIFHMITGLVNTQKCKAIKHTRMNFLTAIGNDTNNNLLGVRVNAA